MMIIVALVIVVGFISYIFLSSVKRQFQIKSINIVQNYKIDNLVMTVNDMAPSYPYERIWSAEHEVGNKYIVTLQIVVELFEGNVYCDNARWRVDIGTNEIKPLNSSAQAFMGVGLFY